MFNQPLLPLVRLGYMYVHMYVHIYVCMPYGLITMASTFVGNSITYLYRIVE